MRTYAILSNKGGAGKTTLAIHLAVSALHAGQSPVLFDLDPQRSATDWSKSRQEQSPIVSPMPLQRLKRAFETVRSSGYTVAILDTPPSTGEASALALQQSDLVLIPCRPGILDIRAIRRTAEAVTVTGNRAYVVLNAVPVNASRVVEDAARACAELGLLVAPVVVHQRASFGHALTIGLTAQEFEPESKAADEIAALWTWASSIT